MPDYGKKIKALRLSLGDTQEKFGKRIGVGQGRVGSWEKYGQRPSMEHAAKIGALMGQTAEQFLELEASIAEPARGARVPVVGQIAAGDWLESPEWAKDDWQYLDVRLPAKYENVPVHGLFVRGDSFNMVYPDGSYVFVVPLKHSAGSPKHGDVVVAVRRDEDGTFETTLKEVVINGNHKWLWPRSTSPEHQMPLRFTGGSKRTAEVTIEGVVIGGQFFR